MGKFVEQETSEKEKAGEYSDGPMLRVRPKGMFLLELRGDDVGDRGKNENPGRMEVDGDSKDFADA